MKRTFVLSPYKVKCVKIAASEISDWGLDLLAIPSLWRSSRGAGIKVAVLDTGIAFNHPDLHSAILNLADFTDGPKDPYDHDGHGTHVAGIIAAGENNRGIIGVAPEAKLLVAKVLKNNRKGSYDAVEKGIRWAIEQKADIISMSMETNDDVSELHKAIKDAEKRGIFVICSAGNSGGSGYLDAVAYPARYPETIGVGSINRNLGISKFSSRGNQVDIVAPGEEILSTYPPRFYAIISGTSMAAPFVAGVVALMLGKHRDRGGKTDVKTLKQLKEHLLKACTDLGPLGKDVHYGQGLINPYKLLESNASYLLDLVLKEDLTEKGIRKIKKFIGGDGTVRPTALNETYLSGSIGDGVGEINGGIRIKL